MKLLLLKFIFNIALEMLQFSASTKNYYCPLIEEEFSDLYAKTGIDVFFRRHCT